MITPSDKSFEGKLDTYGHLKLHLDSGRLLHISNHDTDVTDDWIHISAPTGWNESVPREKIEGVEIVHSHEE